MPTHKNYAENLLMNSKIKDFNSAHDKSLKKLSIEERTKTGLNENQ